MQERLSGIKNGIADNRKHTPPHTLFLRVLDEKWWKICPRRALGSLACRRLQLPGMLHEQTVSPRSGKLFCALDVHERVWTDRLIKRSISLCCVGFFSGDIKLKKKDEKKNILWLYNQQSVRLKQVHTMFTQSIFIARTRWAQTLCHMWLGAWYLFVAHYCAIHQPEIGPSYLFSQCCDEGEMYVRTCTFISFSTRKTG